VSVQYSNIPAKSFVLHLEYCVDIYQPTLEIANL
jgi:hypothetical protein